MIKFKTDCILNVVENFDEDADVITEEFQETFKINEEIDVDIISDNGNSIDIQFGDGSVALGIDKSFIEIIDLDLDLDS